MRDEILRMITTLKTHKMTVAETERELGFSNGLIGKAAKGDTELSEEKLEKFRKFFNTKCGVKPRIETKKMVVNSNGQLKNIPSDEGMKRVRSTMDALNKKFGAGSIMMFGDKPDTSYEVISTGSFGLDLAVGIGGLPRGRMVEIFGWESTGKTTIALNVIANAQKQGLKCMWVDAENAFDPEYADALGVNVDALQFSQPSCGEEGLEIADNSISAGTVQVVVFDSVAALVPKAELSGEHGESKMGLHARLMSQTCRKLTPIIQRHNVLVIFINQLRHKIGVVYGSPEVTTGGNALQFYATMRLHVTRSTTEANSVTNGDGVKEGNLTTVKVIKNKAASPFKSCSFNIIYGKGVDKSSEILDYATHTGTIKKEGNTYTYDGTKLGVGYDVAKTFLDDNEGMRDEIEQKLKT